MDFGRRTDSGEVHRQVLSELEAIASRLEHARQSESAEALDEVHRQLLQLQSSMLSQERSAIEQVVLAYRSCTQDLDRGELLYSSGFDPPQLSEALGISARRVYQLLRMARLPEELKEEVRARGLSERKVRPLLKKLHPTTD